MILAIASSGGAPGRWLAAQARVWGSGISPFPRTDLYPHADSRGTDVVVFMPPTTGLVVGRWGRWGDVSLPSSLWHPHVLTPLRGSGRDVGEALGWRATR